MNSDLHQTEDSGFWMGRCHAILSVAWSGPSQDPESSTALPFLNTNVFVAAREASKRATAVLSREQAPDDLRLLWMKVDHAIYQVVAEAHNWPFGRVDEVVNTIYFATGMAYHLRRTSSPAPVSDSDNSDVEALDELGSLCGFPEMLRLMDAKNLEALLAGALPP